MEDTKFVGNVGSAATAQSQGGNLTLLPNGYYAELLNGVSHLKTVSRFDESSIETIATVLGELTAVSPLSPTVNGHLWSDYRLAKELKPLLLVGEVKLEAGFDYVDLRDLDWNRKFYGTGKNIPSPSEFQLAQAEFLAAFRKSYDGGEVIDTNTTVALENLEGFINRQGTLVDSGDIIVPIYLPIVEQIKKTASFRYGTDELLANAVIKFANQLR